ncbi:hypothetical protein SUGI_0761190 [Cryptomeria japonica]|uniref:extradiol ring-cleavage dioxygenase n=1 Tax=Cryptomeria japonica TaxID=3369 RepID=UPI002414BA97|nr:extradiol ring-cleavage dioxygenase [Cryptomeria japonica]GLJ37465.1 hypothetical protein SUGI_0761190 [Cryptomeria japonica]
MSVIRGFGSEEGLGNKPKRGMDTYFLSHGSPMLALENIPAAAFFKGWSKVMPEKPKAILIISAHWDTSEPIVNAVETNATIYDFYGFPAQLYQMQYNPPGSPDLARRVKELLLSSGFQTVKESPRRGLDHGAWIPLSMMYPNADIPVCQLSVQSRKGAEHHYKMGLALSQLKSEGVLIIGSGQATHNSREDIDINAKTPVSWASTFDKWLNDTLADGKHGEVINFEEKAPYGKKAHPDPDHFYPLLVSLGAAGEGAKAERIHTSWTHGTFSYSSFSFQPSE